MHDEVWVVCQAGCMSLPLEGFEGPLPDGDTELLVSTVVEADAELVEERKVEAEDGSEASRNESELVDPLEEGLPF